MGGASPRARVIRAVAPIRICDNGGWTDTWFARHGRVFNIGVSPYVRVRLRVEPNDAQAKPVSIHVENYGDRYAVTPGALPDRHPLIEAGIDEVGVPDDMSVDISISSGVPPGSSTGTSAATSVALIAALDALTPGRMTAHEIAMTAHRIEVERLGLQSGVQDQLCAAYGGINDIEIPAYPQATVTQIRVPEGVRQELARRLVLVCLGRPHRSSDVHDRVIAERAGHRENASVLEGLRQAAAEARDAVCHADFEALGRAMTANTELQRQLHPDLVGAHAQVVIDTAVAAGAAGWKVNGAGGEGGSVTLLCDAKAESPARLRNCVLQADPLFEVVPTTITREGVRVWEERPGR